MLRLRGLTAVDPLRVPLPHGTEVTTRADRVVAGRTVRGGALGRVRAVDADGVLVRLVGVGDVRYARDEVVPHKAGQVEFALRRAAAWDALRGHAIIDTVVGSRAWGLFR